MVTASRSGFIYVYNVVGTALSFQSVHRRGGTSQTWNNLYSSNQAGDALITDVGYVINAFIKVFLFEWFIFTPIFLGFFIV